MAFYSIVVKFSNSKKGLEQVFIGLSQQNKHQKETIQHRILGIQKLNETKAYFSILSLTLICWIFEISYFFERNINRGKDHITAYTSFITNLKERILHDDVHPLIFYDRTLNHTSWIYLLYKFQKQMNFMLGYSNLREQILILDDQIKHRYPEIRQISDKAIDDHLKEVMTQIEDKIVVHPEQLLKFIKTSSSNQEHHALIYFLTTENTLVYMNAAKRYKLLEDQILSCYYSSQKQSDNDNTFLINLLVHFAPKSLIEKVQKFSNQVIARGWEAFPLLVEAFEDIKNDVFTSFLKKFFLGIIYTDKKVSHKMFDIDEVFNLACLIDEPTYNQTSESERDILTNTFQKLNTEIILEFLLKILKSQFNTRGYDQAYDQLQYFFGDDQLGGDWLNITPNHKHTISQMRHRLKYLLVKYLAETKDSKITPHRESILQSDVILYHTVHVIKTSMLEGEHTWKSKRPMQAGFDYKIETSTKLYDNIDKFFVIKNVDDDEIVEIQVEAEKELDKSKSDFEKGSEITYNLSEVLENNRIENIKRDEIGKFAQQLKQKKEEKNQLKGELAEIEMREDRVKELEMNGEYQSNKLLEANEVDEVQERLNTSKNSQSLVQNLKRFLEYAKVSDNKVKLQNLKVLVD